MFAVIILAVHIVLLHVCTSMRSLYAFSSPFGWLILVSHYLFLFSLFVVETRVAKLYIYIYDLEVIRIL